MGRGTRALLLPLAIAMGGLPGCRCVVETEYVYVCDAATAPDGPPPDGPSPDAPPPDATPLDATPPDATLPDAMPACTTGGDTADHLEWLGGGAPTCSPPLTVDGFGAAALVQDGAGARFVRVGADGARRTADVDLALPPYAIAFDGTGYVISTRNGLGMVEVRTLSSAGVLGPPTIIGTGTPVEHGLAVHASGDVAVMWRANPDLSLRATVIAAGGGTTETLLDPEPHPGLDDVGGVIANAAASPRFVTAYARDAGATYVVEARTLGPAGAAVNLDTSATLLQRVQPVPGAAPDTTLVTWREDAIVHGAIVDEAAAITLAPRVLVTALAPQWHSRVAGRARADGGFDLALDVYDTTTTDRWVEVRAFDAAGDAVGAAVRVATICSLACSEGALPFVRNADVRYATWVDLDVGGSILAAF